MTVILTILTSVIQLAAVVFFLALIYLAIKSIVTWVVDQRMREFEATYLASRAPVYLTSSNDEVFNQEVA